MKHTKNALNMFLLGPFSCIPYQDSYLVCFKLPETPGSLTGLPSSWKPISYLYKLKILCLTHKIFYGVCPEKLSFIIKKSPIFRNMRDNLKLTMESPNTNFGRQSFRHRSAILEQHSPLG